MLQAHSFLWHYLWIAPNAMLASLGLVISRRGFRQQFPVFVTFAFLTSTIQLGVYAADISPRVTPENFWRVFWAALLIEGSLKIILVGELFGHVFGSYPSIAGVGRSSIRAVGGFLVLAAVIGVAYAQTDNNHLLISGAHLIEETIYLIECGLLLFIFLFAAYFRLAWNSKPFGIALGLGISACVHLATWAVMANGGLMDKRHLLDFLNMATYHVCVLIWFYYLLVPEKSVTTSAVSLPEHDLAIWNRELERLLQQ
jgi:hypothetical protein